MLKSTLYRDRATVLPKLPRSLDDLILPDIFTKNLYNENMLFCDKKKPLRILGFASLTAIKQLAECSIWNADGTFKTAPKLFTQSYTIHAHNEFSMKPIIFSALPNKYEKTYSALLKSLISYAKTNNLILSPTSILIDFELSSFNAFTKAFPNTNILFCHFHFAKNIMKNVKKLQELITLYNHCPPNERTLYEMIFPINLVKTYIDFEYYIDNNLDINDHHIGAKCFIKILHYVLNFFDHKHHENENYLHITLQQFLVLESVSELAYLLVMNKQNQHNLAIDLNVYSKNQQFRLYDCVKRGQINFLRQSTYFQFNEPFETSYHTILKKSIITYNIEHSNLQAVYLE
ncbi:unnamed protein product, partial [Rotaria sp. Silwood1]